MTVRGSGKKGSIHYLIPLLGILGAVLFMRFSFSHPTEKVTEITRMHALAFKNTLETLTYEAEALQYGKGDVEKLRRAVSDARLAYKKIEFLLEYYYPEYVEEHINGAPLWHIQRYSSRPNVLPPQGLQVLDELIYSDELLAEKTEIAVLARTLQNDFETLHNSFRNRRIEQYEVVEAMRMELVRIMAMGVTGFDTPGSLNALSEARTSLEALHTAAGEYLAISDKDKGQKINSLFTGALRQLEQSPGFDDFDRLTFLKEYVDPLYRELATAFPNTKVPAHKKTSWGWNSNSTSIFGEDFLDPYFYAELNEEEDSEAIRTLGKKLFYDPYLSQNNQMSCASCHNPEKAFTDGQAKSISIVKDETVQRNAPTLLNAVFADRYFYDLRAFSLEQQAEHVIFNHMEFNTAYEEIIQKLNEKKEYKTLIKEAFGQRHLKREEFSMALASYVLSLQSFNSEFDRYVRGEIEQIDPKVKEGFNLFMGKAACGTCHFAPTFAGLVPPQFAKNESEILGVLEDPDAGEKKLDRDGGRLASNMYSEMAWIYEKSFKTSTIRNVELTAPYFHNGAYKALEEVVDFYDHGGGSGLGLKVVNQTLSADSLHLTIGEKEALVAFMKSLTDNRAGNEAY